MKTIKTVGGLRAAISHIGDDTMLVESVLSVKLVKAHFVDNHFYTFHHEYGCAGCYNSFRYPNNKLVDALVIS